MKTKNFLTKTFLLAAMMLVGSSQMWADGTPLPIPQDNNSYIVLGSATGTENFASYISTKTNCTIDSRLGDATNNKYYTIGTSYGQNTATLAIDVTTDENGAGNYLFGFKTGANNSSASTVDVTIQESGSSTTTTIASDEVVPNNGNWDPTIPHLFKISNLKASTTYTITITATKTGGNYCGNFGQFYFHKPSQYTCLTTIDNNEATTLSLEKTDMLNYYFKLSNGGKQSGGNLGYIQNGDFVEYLLNNTTEQTYVISFEAAAQQDNDQITISLNNLDATSCSQTFTITNDGTSNYHKYSIAINNVTTGYKTLKVSFATSATYAPDLKNLQITPVNKLPNTALNENTNYTPSEIITNVTLTRTINAGKWSTIVLPFDMTKEQVTATFGENVKLAQFTDYNSETKEVTMSAATTMNANEPYMIKVAENQYYSPVTINGVTIVEPDPSAAKTYSSITFQGVYQSGTIHNGDYYVKDNQLFKATGTQTIKPFRAYFTGVPAEARLMFFDDETTSIANVDVKANDNFDANAPIFNLAGQRVGKNYKGVVIQNGKKYILK